MWVQLALMYNSYSLDFDYTNTMMSFEVLGYMLEWTKKVSTCLNTYVGYTMIYMPCPSSRY